MLVLLRREESASGNEVGFGRILSSCRLLHHNIIIFLLFLSSLLRSDNVELPRNVVALDDPRGVRIVFVYNLFRVDLLVLFFLLQIAQIVGHLLQSL